MDQILEGLRGVVSIADDIAVYDENEEEHDKNLLNQMEWTAKAKVKSVWSNKSEKYMMKQSSISFFSNLYTD